MATKRMLSFVRQKKKIHSFGYQPLVLIQAAVSAPILEAICPPSSITVLVMSPFDLLVLPTITNFIPSNGLLELKFQTNVQEIFT